MTSLSQSSTLLGAPSPPSLTLQLTVSASLTFSAISTVLIAFSFLATSDNRCECESSVVTAVLGGVLAVVIVTAIAVQVMVIVFFMRKLQRARGIL